MYTSTHPKPQTQTHVGVRQQERYSMAGGAAQGHPLATPPVPVQHLVGVAVEGEAVEVDLRDGGPREHTEARPHAPAVEGVGEGQHLVHLRKGEKR